MNRRQFLRYTLAGTITSGLAGCQRNMFGTTGGAKRPNILFVFSDDHALQAIGAYKSRLQKFVRQQKITPNIDRLAKRGATFTNSFCGNSICGPSRATILTGKHSHINGFMTNENKDFEGSQWTFPKTLRKGGYQTAMIGKWHLGSEPTGFDHWDVLPGQGNYYNPDFKNANGKYRIEGYATDVITEKAIKWLNEDRDKDKPFMLMCQQKAPHRPWMPALRYLDLLDDVDIPEPDTLFDDYAGRTSSAADQEMMIDKHMNMNIDLKVTPLLSDGDEPLPHCMKRMNVEQKRKWDTAYGPKNDAFRKAKLKGKDLVRWKYQRYMKDYLRCIKAVDDSVGSLVSCLKENGLDKNTVVIYCSDQGFYLGEHGWFDKRWMYEESLKMPFIIKWSGVVKPGTEQKEMIQNIDYAPTFLEIAGMKAPGDVQGVSFAQILKGRTPNNWRDSIYYHYYEYPIWHRVRKHRGVRNQRYKLMHFYRVDEWEMYDLKTDPQEMKSVYNDPEYASIRKELETEMDRLARMYKDPIID